MNNSGSIIFLRHGRTAFNAQGLLQGHADNVLDEVGQSQARAVAQFLRAELSPDTLFISSPLLRAQTTATVIADMCGGTVEIDGRWIELNYGIFEGLAQSAVPVSVWKAWRSDNDFAPQQGESLAQVQERVTGACEDLSVRLNGRTAVVVTHVSPIKSAVAWALGVDVGVGWRTQLDTASITRIGITERGPVLRCFNATVPY